MTPASVALAPQPTLADAVDEALAVALDGGQVLCLWCGATASRVVADRFSGRVVVRCPECGSEFEGVRPRRPGEGRT
jgi:hypothetical protein